jgi:hypothetical protein
MFNAVNGLGAAGQFGSESGASDNANSALYATFAVVGFFSGSITNKLGIKTAISFGGLGYSVNIAAYLCYNHTKNVGFPWMLRWSSVECSRPDHDVVPA